MYFFIFFTGRIMEESEIIETPTILKIDPIAILKIETKEMFQCVINQSVL